MYKKYLLPSAKSFLDNIKNRLNPPLGFQPFLLSMLLLQNINNMNKGTHFIGQPMSGQLLNFHCYIFLLLLFLSEFSL